MITRYADKTQRPVNVWNAGVVAVRLRPGVDLMQSVQPDGIDIEIGHHFQVFDHDADMAPVFDSHVLDSPLK